jgi:biopolymer transport protein ExbD
MAGRLGGGGDEPMVDINIVPLVDVTLVVLIIFMVTTTSIMAIKVNLPDAATGESQDDSSLAIVVDAQGELTMDGAPVSEDELRARVREAHARNPEVVCLISGDRDARHGDVIHLVDVVKQEGVARYAFNIDPPDVQPAP